jgi:glycosyltransferase involved in cell wall biosynthesis
MTAAALAAPASSMSTRRVSVIAAMHPLTTGAAHFNGAMVAALRARGPVDVLSWRRMYPPLVYRGPERDDTSRPPRRERADFVLDWADPRTWRHAIRRVERFGADALILPWLHPVMAPPYRWLLRHVPRSVTRVVVCHNVLPHESFFGARPLTRATLRHADLLVTHARTAEAELAALGLAAVPRVTAFHPRFVAGDLAAPPAPEAVAAERVRQGNPELALLFFGSVRPYKGLDLALEALARVDPARSIRLVVAGRFWPGGPDYAEQVRRLGLAERVELRDGYVSNEEASLLFSACDAVLMPYRSATQSGVVQLAFAHGRPVIATRVGGLTEAVSDGTDGLLCAPDPEALARSIERMAEQHAELAAAVEQDAERWSFARYAHLIDDAVGSPCA